MKPILCLFLACLLVCVGCSPFVPKKTTGPFPVRTATALPENKEEAVPFKIWISNNALVLPSPDCPVLSAIAQKYGLRFILTKSHTEPMSDLSLIMAQGDYPQALTLTQKEYVDYARERNWITPLTNGIHAYAPSLQNTLAPYLSYIKEEGEIWFLPMQYAKGGIENLYPETGLGVHLRSDLVQKETSIKAWEELWAFAETKTRLIVPMMNEDCVRDFIGLSAGSASLCVSEDALYQTSTGKIQSFFQNEEFLHFLRFLRKQENLICAQDWDTALSLLTQNDPCILLGDSWTGLGQAVADQTDHLLLQTFPTYQGEKPTYLPYSIGLYDCGTCLTNNLTSTQFVRFFLALDKFSTEEGHLDILGLLKKEKAEKDVVYDYEVSLSLRGENGRMSIVPTKETLENMQKNPDYPALRGQNALAMLSYGNQNDPDGYYDVVGNPANGVWSEEMNQKYALLGWTEENYFDKMRSAAVDVTPLRAFYFSLPPSHQEKIDESIFLTGRYLPTLLSCKEEEFQKHWLKYQQDIASCLAFLKEQGP